MLTDAELTGMRETSVLALPDTGTVKRGATGGSLNTGTGVLTPDAASTIYTGAMRVRPASAEDLRVLFGDADVSRVRYIATLPHTATGILIDDRLDVVTDADLGDVSFRVTVVPVGSFLIDRRLGLEAVE